MRSNSPLVILAVLVFLAAAASSAKRNGPLVGGWKPIEDLSDPHVKEIADFAVSEYNKQSKASLKLKRVVKGETQVVAGMNYRLVLAVLNGAAAEQYEAVVWEKPWQHFRNLTSFKPAA